MMPFGHARWRREVSLLAVDALGGRDRAAAEAHARGCAECRADLESLQRVLAESKAADHAHAAELPIPLAALVTRVQAEIDARLAAPRPRPAAWRWAAAAGLVLAAALAVMMVRAGGRPSTVAVVPPGPAPLEVAADPEAILRMESALAREQAARYLADAQDVLVHVADPERCRRGKGLVDVEAEARRSRELLERRALLVDVEAPGVESAAPLLGDVEAVLRDVAALEDCARSRDLDALNRRLEKTRLLMKIDIVTRELAG